MDPWIIPDPISNGGLKSRAPLGFTGEGRLWFTKTAPAGWLICNGAAVSRTLYNELYSLIAPLLGTFTVTIATPAVGTLVAHGLETGDAVFLNTTGALPTGLSANTIYYLIKVTADTFNLATTRANAVAGTKIATSGTQSGVHRLTFCPYGLGDGSTTFNLPDFRDNVPVGYKSADDTFYNLGIVAGEKTHTLTIAEMPAHTHSKATQFGNAPGAFSDDSIWTKVASTAGGTVNPTGSTGGGGAHNVIQPSLVVNFIIKT